MSIRDYSDLEKIGKGSYGSVYTARNKRDGAQYCIKRVPFEEATAKVEGVALRECNVLSSLRHPHIVPYKEFFKDGSDLCLVMAHCEGGDLYRHVKALRASNKWVDEDTAWSWVVQMMLAIQYCHSKKILHRDIKTQNVFLTRDGRLMLGDFGLAKQFQATLEMARTPIGTPYYMAPEIYEEAPYSFKSDVWALGCVMYEALTGVPAFKADNLCRVVIRVLKGQYDPLPDRYSPELRSLVDRMLTRLPKDRPSINELLQSPSVVTRVQQYLDQLCAAGVGAGWSTWRMNLPPGLLLQMVSIVEASQSCELEVLRSQVNKVKTHKGGVPAAGARAAKGAKPAARPGAKQAPATAAARDDEYSDDYEDDFEEDDGDRGGAAAQLLGLMGALPKGGFRDAPSARPSPVQSGAAVPIQAMSPNASGRLVPLKMAPALGGRVELTGKGAANAGWAGAAVLGGNRPKFHGGITSSKIDLHGTLTNRAVFLQRELQLQLGSNLEAACAAVSKAHRAAPGGGLAAGVKDSRLREALGGVVSPAHIELAPLLDELVLLREKGYTAGPPTMGTISQKG
ncbi:hypothetical protein FOA52_013635 [Chlamydomonas sp. UWO 241]|nr:hypothetical protein FOA52_013635 [Chlamydomonas sp. UWO 241]